MSSAAETFSARERLRTTVAVVVVAIGAVAAVALASWLDAHRPPPLETSDENLYLSGNTARRMSLGFNGLAADWYWMRSLQYVGRKVLAIPQNVQLDDISQLNLKLLPSLLDTATTLDPQFYEPYEYAAVLLPRIDVNEAIRITNKGIAANPNSWRLYQHLGYIYWQQHDYQTAREVYARGSRLPGAPAWMEAMSAKMAAEGGSRNVAREIYTRMYEQAVDEKVKEMARRHLLQLDFFDERDVLHQVFSAYRNSFKRCPSNWHEVAPVLRAMKWRLDSNGLPLDPSAVPYVLVKEKCEVELDPSSEVPPK
jgi:tetratricopeptide (TPR) repeat protein